MSSFDHHDMILSRSLQDLSTILRPSGPADVGALLVFAIATAGYLLRGTLWDKPDPYYHIYFESPQSKDGATQNAQKQTRNIAQKLEEYGKKVVVFWGSQSGTAEGFAQRLARELHLRFGLETMTADLSDYDPETINLISDNKVAIFMMSTYGEGDPSDNATTFWDWIHNAKGVTLTNLHYAAFGLGNSNYKYYNRVIDVAVQQLDQLGSKALFPVGKADDAKGSTEEDFIAWKETLFATLKRQLHLDERPVTYQPTLSVVEDTSLEPIDLHHGEPSQSKASTKASAASSEIRPIPIKAARELFKSTDRNCIHMELDITDEQGLHYKTGDHLAVWPMNPDEEVDRLLKALGLLERRSTPVSIKSLDPTVKVKVPTPTTTEALLRHYLEICAPVSRDTIVALIQFAPDEVSKSYLEKLSKDKDSYTTFLTRTHINLGRLLSLASPSKPWIALPLSYIVEILPSIQPRYYSISSSSVIDPRSPTITALVSRTDFSSDLSETFHGLTSTYLLALSHSHNRSIPSRKNPTYPLSGPLNALSDGNKLYASIRRSNFRLPVNAACPVIMVAAGTGLAPFRAFIAERAKLKSVGRDVGEMLLFFGCRSPEEDFIYRDEIEEMQNSVLGGETLKIFTAYSRLPDHDKKVYVQHRVQENASDVVRLIVDQTANFYICGRASMGREVGKIVGEVVGKIKNWEDAEIEQWSEGMKKKGKWREDVWG